jgi:thiosulfate/3-mercaptopyruvate sulfurtransferase
MPRSETTALPSPLVETDWLAAHVDAPDLRILDCSVVRQDYPDGSYSFVSGQAEWAAAHVPGSIHVDVLEELSDPQAATSLTMPSIPAFAALMAARGVGTGTRVVLYDSSNHAWAARVWWMLRTCGFDDAAVLNGGLGKWRAEGRPVCNEASAYPPASFTPAPRPGLMATKADVLASLDDPGAQRVYALPPAIFSGAVRIFPRPGRIPRSVNVHCDTLLDPQTGAYLDPASLRALFDEAGVLAADRVITYCGGGIAASSDALALVAIGMGEVAVYDGSMTEWTADPDTPMETD